MPSSACRISGTFWSDNYTRLSQWRSDTSKFCHIIYREIYRNTNIVGFSIENEQVTCSPRLVWGFGFSQKFDDIRKRVHPVDESSEWELLSNYTLMMGFLVGWSHFSFPYRGWALPRYKSRGCPYLFTQLPLVPAVLRCSAVNHYHIQNSVPWPVWFIRTVFWYGCAQGCTALHV